MSEVHDLELMRAIALLQAGDWDGAHAIVQKRDDQLSCRIHAILHRLEGDNSNAAYWYRQAGITVPKITIEQEIQALAGESAKN